MSQTGRGFTKCFRMRRQRRVAPFEASGSSPNEKENPGPSNTHHPAAGDGPGTSSPLNAEKQPTEPWLRKKGRKLFNYLRGKGPREKSHLDGGSAFPTSQDNTHPAAGDGPGTSSSQRSTEKQSAEPWLRKKGQKLWSCCLRGKGPREKSRLDGGSAFPTSQEELECPNTCPEAGDPGAEMATSQDSVEQPPSASGSLPFEQDPTVIGDQKGPNVNMNHSERVAESGEEQTGEEEQLPSVSDSVALEDNLGDIRESGQHSESIPTESLENVTHDPNALPILNELDDERVEDMAYPSTSSESPQEEQALLPFQASPFASLKAKADLHGLCQMFSNSSRERAWKIADNVAEYSMALFLEHVLEVDEEECVALMVAVLASSKCDMDNVVHLVIRMVAGKGFSFPLGGVKQHEMRIKAVRFIRTLINWIPRTERLDKWARDFNDIFSNIMAEVVLSSEQVITGGFIALEEIADAIKVLDDRWNILSSTFAKHCASVS